GGTTNTFLGLSAGAANPTGADNTFLGATAGQKNTTGFSNTFVGFDSGNNNTTGKGNVAVGTAAGATNNGNDNTFIGAAAGQLNTSGVQNVFVGLGAGQNNTAGLQNIFLGANSGTSNTTESSNTFLGFNTNGNSGISNATALGSNAKVTRSNSVVLGSLTDSNGNTTDTFVGIGTTSPLTKLNVIEPDSNVFRVLRLEGSSTLGVWSELVNNSAGGHSWAILSAGSSNSEGAGNLIYTDQTGGGKIVMHGSLDVPSCTGCTNSSSDRNVKSNFAPVNNRSVLERLVGIPIQTWNYNSDPASIRHIGPMAQDFYAAFGVGSDDKHINLLDEGGVAFAAIQELYKSNQAKDQQINDLTKRIEALEKVVEKLTKPQQ